MCLLRAVEPDKLNPERTDEKKRWSAIIKQRKVAFVLSIILLLFPFNNIIFIK